MTQTHHYLWDLRHLSIYPSRIASRKIASFSHHGSSSSAGSSGCRNAPG